MRRKERLKDMQQVDKTKFKNYKPGNERIEVDRSEIETVLKEFHDAPLGGHVGVRRMKKE